MISQKYTAFDEGYDAYQRTNGRQDIARNPYSVGTKERSDWFKGWQSAEDSLRGQWDGMEEY